MPLAPPPKKFILRKPSDSVPELLRRKREALRKKGRKLIFKAPYIPKAPKGIQREYFLALKPILATLKAIVKRTILPALSDVLASAAALRPAKADDYADDIERIMKVAKIQFAQAFSDDELAAIAKTIASKTEQFNARELDRSIGRVLGVDVFRSEPWLNQEMNAFLKNNVSLIKTVPDEYFGRIEKIVMQGARSGDLTDKIAETIEDKTEPYAESRVALIARDQVSKFNANLNELRQKEVGISQYIWKTGEDERVRGNPDGLYPNARPSHYARDGKTFSWDDPPQESPDDGHPGEPINCRCIALPIFSPEDTGAASEVTPESNPEE